MATPLRVLLLEDREADARLVLRELHNAGFEPSWSRVETEKDYVASLAPSLDIILADFSLPQFDALRALELLRERRLDVPVIIVSGSIGEDLAVRALQHGANDYLLKDRLGRLGPAIRQALESKQLHRDRRQVEEQLRIQSQALSAAANGILITDKNGNIIWANPAFTGISGYALDEVRGRNPRFLKSGQHRPPFFQELWRTILSGKVWKGAVVNRRKEGGLYSVEQTITPVRDDAGDVSCFIAIEQDITERTRLEEQVRQAQKMEAVGRLAGGVAHDFNNILTVIGGFCDVAIEAVAPEDPIASDLVEIKKASDRGASLTRQLLAFSRRQILSPKVLDLNRLIREMQKMLARILGEDVEICLALAQRLGAIEADPGQIEQVLLNLAVNARDAMPNGGRLTIETKAGTLDAADSDRPLVAKEGDDVLLTVSDTGVGMDETIRSQLFEPFFTTKDEGKGTGLGLATIYGIVQQSRGNIAVSSEPGQGTVFKISFPRVENSSAPTKTETVKPVVVGGSETVLLAEDEETLRGLTERVLMKNGYRVLTARDGAEAIQLLQAHQGPIHLLLTDVVMPKAGGRQVALQAAQRFPEIKVLFISGYTDDAIVRNGILAAEIAFLQKPFTPEAILIKVRQVLDGQP